MSDTLYTYMGAIISRAQALLGERDGSLNKKQREVVKTIISSAERFLLLYNRRADLSPGEFFFTMRFETSTALTPIRGYADLLSMGVIGTLNEPQRDHVDSILRNARSLRDAVDALVSGALAGPSKIA